MAEDTDRVDGQAQEAAAAPGPPIGSEAAAPAPDQAPSAPAATTPSPAVEQTPTAADPLAGAEVSVVAEPPVGGFAERTGEALERARATSGRIASAMVDRLRNDAEFTADRGTTRIEDEVVEKIAGIAAREVAGVHDLGGDTTRLFAAVRERVGLGESEQGNRGVSVRLDGDQAKIRITLVVEYGVKVHPVTVAVRAAVVTAVEEMLDLKVSEVNLVVDDVHLPDRAS